MSRVRVQCKKGIDFGTYDLGALDQSLELYELPFLRQFSAASGLHISIRINGRHVQHIAYDIVCALKITAVIAANIQRKCTKEF